MESLPHIDQMENYLRTHATDRPRWAIVATCLTPDQGAAAQLAKTVPAPWTLHHAPYFIPPPTSPILEAQDLSWPTPESGNMVVIEPGPGWYVEFIAVLTPPVGTSLRAHFAALHERLPPGCRLTGSGLGPPPELPA
jgi:hypothetical protein